MLFEKIFICIYIYIQIENQIHKTMMNNGVHSHKHKALSNISIQYLLHLNVTLDTWLYTNHDKMHSWGNVTIKNIHLQDKNESHKILL